MNTSVTFKFLIMLMLAFGHHAELKAQEDISKDANNKIVPADSTILNTMWKNALNTRDSVLMKLYTQDAIKVVSNDSIWTGSAGIYEHYRSQPEINYVITPYTIDANKYRGITYEINIYKPKDAPIMVQLVIYEMKRDQKLRVFEYEAARPILNPESVPEDIREQLRERREQWMAYCNAHQVNELVNDLYSEHTMYFNHRPLVKGRAALIQEYGYMNNEQYELTLMPRRLTYVNDSTVFEIGQCKGSYNGKYILIWKKEEDGQWRIFIDSNV